LNQREALILREAQQGRWGNEMIRSSLTSRRPKRVVAISMRTPFLTGGADFDSAPAQSTFARGLLRFGGESAAPRHTRHPCREIFLSMVCLKHTLQILAQGADHSARWPRLRAAVAGVVIPIRFIAIAVSTDESVCRFLFSSQKVQQGQIEQAAGGLQIGLKPSAKLEAGGWLR